MGGRLSRSARARELVRVCRELANDVDALHFGGKVAYVYNPLVYARDMVEQYIDRFAGHRGIALLLGMNPGPWGMAQTGVPFGEVAAVRDWLRLSGKVGKPKREHPKRKVLGLDCQRAEVSGSRLWGWAKTRYSSPSAFFKRFFVWNYCPLVFMVESGANYTPDKLPVDERRLLQARCDTALAEAVDILEPSIIVGVGKFAEKRAASVIGPGGPPVATVLHPSPASPIANRGWAPQAEAQLAALGLLDPS